MRKLTVDDIPDYIVHTNNIPVLVKVLNDLLEDDDGN